MSDAAVEPLDRMRTGIEGLDSILGGGYPKGNFVLIQGDPGTGKTTAGVQFLLDGAANGERVVFVALGNSRQQLERLSASHGWSLDGIAFEELAVEEIFSGRQTVFPSRDVELSELTTWLREVLDEHRPQRMVIDAISYLRTLSEDLARYRMEVIALRKLLEETRISTLVIDSFDAEEDVTLQSLTDGTITFEQLERHYGGQRLQVIVEKMRYIPFHGGYHDFEVRTGGVEVFPRLVPAPRREASSWTQLGSGIDELDAMVGGGLERGSACMMIGPSGTGKSTLCNLYLDMVLKRDARAAVFLFEERLDMFYHRTGALGFEFDREAYEERLWLEKVDVGTISPGEFGQMIGRAVDWGAEVVVIDSLSGYFSSMVEEETLLSQVSDLINFLVQSDVLVLFTVEQRGLVGDALTAPISVSALSDTVLLLRYATNDGEIRKTVTALKKRHGPHEKVPRRLIISPERITVGQEEGEIRHLLDTSLEFGR